MNITTSRKKSAISDDSAKKTFGAKDARCTAKTEDNVEILGLHGFVRHKAGDTQKKEKSPDVRQHVRAEDARNPHDNGIIAHPPDNSKEETI